VSDTAQVAATARRGLRALLVAATAAAVMLALSPAAAGAPSPAAVPLSVAPAVAAVAPAVAPTVLAIRESQAVPLVCFDRDLLAYVNKARAAHHLPPLVETPSLVTAADGWATHLAAGASAAEFRHNPDLRATVLTDMPGVRTYGENIATFTTGQFSAYAMLKAYLASPSHRANILNPDYRYVGIVTRHGTGNSYTTMNFAG
jgi:uncharacterized protein YkwD